MLEPVLRIVSTRSLVLHETVDPKRVNKLVQKFKQAKVFTHPPLVAELGKNQYVVLDGANRVTAARILGLPSILVQIVNYQAAEVKLLTWNHVVAGVAWNSLRSAIEKSCQQKLVTKKISKLEIAIIARTGQKFGFSWPVGESARLSLWNNLAKAYLGKFLVKRIEYSDWKNAKHLLSNPAALIIYPALKKSDILRFSKKGFKIPGGVSRHVIPGRALHVNVPFLLLKSTKSLGRKNKWLSQYLANLMQSNRVRYYTEPVYLFDE